MKKDIWLWAAVGFVAGCTTFAVVPESWLFVELHPSHASSDAPKEVWACPMLCVKLSGPGTCPVCGMDLEKLEDTGERLQLNERERRIIKLATTPVKRRVLERSIRSFGRIDLNERRVERITAWMPGRITRLFADTTFTEVRAGDHLFEIYSPQLLEVQNDYLTAVKNRSRGGFEKQLYESTRKKLLLYGLRPSQLRTIEAAGKPSDLIIIRAPKSGTIFERHLSEGDYVKEGSPLYTIADYSTLWLFFDAYETDLPWIAVGQKVTLTLDARPGREYAGLVEFINPVVDEQTRTTKVRVVLDNPSLTLKAGMFANVEIAAQLAADGTAAAPKLAGRYGCYMHPEVHLDSPGRCPICGMRAELRTSDDDEQANEARPVLTIPRSAVLDTGARQLVYVMSQPPKWEKHGEDWVEVAAAEFESREVTLGAYAGQDVMVGDGLREGEIVVTRGNFLIDSQMELLGKPSLLHAEGSASSSGSHADH